MGKDEQRDKQTIQKLLGILGNEEVPAGESLVAMMDAYSDTDFPESISYPEEVYDLIDELMIPWVNSSGLVEEDFGEDIVDIESTEWRKQQALLFRRLAKLVLEFPS